MALIGVLARIDTARRAKVSEDLTRLRGVSLFSVGEHERIGILVERDSLAESHAALQGEIETTAGVLGAWPVFSYAGDLDESESAVDNSHSVEADVDG